MFNARNGWAGDFVVVCMLCLADYSDFLCLKTISSYSWEETYEKISVLLLALSLALSLCVCSKASQIPSLAEIVENGAEWGGEQIQQVQGCTLADLEKAWGKADGELPGEYA